MSACQVAIATRNGHPFCLRLREMTPSPPDHSGHPSGFAFNYSFWFGCACGLRNRVSSDQYMALRESGDPDLSCECGEPIDIGDRGPILRDLDDVDYISGRIDEHYWYHSSTYEDWPSETYEQDLHDEYSRVEMWSEEFRDEAVRDKISVALHLGTYAAAVENMLRRPTDEQTSGRDYWLHQVRIRLGPGDLSSDLDDEGWSVYGNFPARELDRRGVRAVRYVNLHEAPGSISLAIHPGAITDIITEVRSIRLPLEDAAAPLVPDGDTATTKAISDLEATEELRPDITGVPPDQIFENPFKFRSAQRRREVSDEAIAVNEQLHRYCEEREKVWASLHRELVAAYLGEVSSWVQHRFKSALATTAPAADENPEAYHLRFRMLAGLLVQPHLVVQQFEKAPWRKLA